MEKRNRAIVEIVRSILKHKSLPQEFWGEVVNAVVYLLNQVPIKSQEEMTPYEVWIEKKP